MAERYGAERGEVSDIFLPDALARTIPLWSIPLVVLGSGLHIGRRITRRRAMQRV
jgi:cytochrome c-type biogenesis protein CcmH/NrfF